MGRGVSTCATCERARSSGIARSVVVGGANTALEEAIFLTRFASKVLLVHRRDQFRASKIMVDRARGIPKIEFVLDNRDRGHPRPGQERGLRGPAEKHEGWSETVRTVDGVFVAIGHDPNTKISRGN